MPIGSRAGILERFARSLTNWTGSTYAFVLAASVIACWLVTGPLFAFSDTWQLVINTSTTIVTFLMVFLIQRAQNKDSLAIHVKLNELLAAHPGASNRLLNVEGLSEQELHHLLAYYTKLVELSAKEHDLRLSHSVDEAEFRHAEKRSAVQERHAARSAGKHRKGQ